jgi:hypothetical protein
VVNRVLVLHVGVEAKNHLPPILLNHRQESATRLKNHHKITPSLDTPSREI